MTHTIHVDSRNVITFDGETIGSTERVRHNTYAALDTDGNVVAPNCYGNGGGKHVAAYILAHRLGLLPDGAEFVQTGPQGYTAGPYTSRAEVS